MQIAISDGRTARSADSIDEAPNIPAKETEAGQAPPVSPSRPPQILDGNWETGLTNSAAIGIPHDEVVHLTITGEQSPIHFIKSGLILDSAEPSKEERKLLLAAVDAIASALVPSPVIIDADSNVGSGIPFLLFGRDEFDLTSQVKSVYDSMLTAPVHFVETTLPHP